MTFFSKAGTIVCPAATGNQVITCGFQPTTIFFWGTTQTVAGDAADAYWCVGGYSSSGISCEAYNSQANNSGTTSLGNSCYSGARVTGVVNPGSAAIVAGASVISTSSTGFTLSWTTVTSGALLHYLAIGGTEVQSFSSAITPRTSTGTQAITGVGFQPKMVIFFYGNNAVTGGASGFGVAVSPTNRWACGMGQAVSASMSSSALASRIQDTTKCVALVGNGGQTTNFASGDLVSMDADGFTLNWTAVPPAPFSLGYVALGGSGQYTSGTIVKNANTTDASVAVPVGFTPGGFMLFGNGATNSTAQSTGWRLATWGADNPAYNNPPQSTTYYTGRSINAEVKNGVINTQARRYGSGDYAPGSNDYFFQRALPASVSAAGTTEVGLSLSVNSWSSTGLTLNYAVNTVTTQYVFPWIAFGPAGVTEPPNALAGVTDDFEGASLDGVKWTTWGTGTNMMYKEGYTKTGTLLQQVAGSSTNYVGVISQTAYDLTNDAVSAQFVTLTNMYAGSQMYLRCEIDASNAVILGYENGNYFYQHQIAGATSTIDTWPRVANSIALKLNFDNAQNRIWWDVYTLNGWQNRGSEALPIATTALKVVLGTGCFQAVAQPGIVTWDRVSLPIVKNLWLAPSLTSAGAATEVGQPTRRRPVTGTSVGVSTSAAQPRRKISLVGASAVGIAVASGTISSTVAPPVVYKNLTGASAGKATCGPAAGGNPSVGKPAGAYTFDAANPLATNLKIWLAMLETSGTTLADIAGTAQNGSIVGTVDWGTAGAPNGGSYVELRTDNGQRISLGDQPTHGLSTGQFQAFSFSMWVRMDNTDFGSKKLFSGGYFSDAPFMRIVPGYNLYYQYGGPAGASSTASFNDPGLVANTWYHIVYTDDGTDASGAVKCYVNGSALTVNAGETNYSASGKSGVWDKNGTYGAAFGAEAPFGDDWHPASYDSLMIWERALSAPEVSSLYSSPYGLLLVGTPAGGYTSTVQATSGLLTYWPMHETAGAGLINDDIGSTDLTIFSGVTQGVADGLPGDLTPKSIRLDGTVNSRVMNTNPTDIVALAATNFTFEWWFFQTAADNAANQSWGAPFFEFGDGVSNIGLNAWNYDSLTKFYVGLTPTQAMSAAGVTTTDAWQHYAVVRNGLNGILYVDGVEVVRVTDVGTTQILNWRFQLGFRETPDYGGQYLYRRGQFTQVAVYNAALSPVTVAAHYAAGMTPPSVGGGATEIDKKVSLGVRTSTGAATASATILRRRAITGISAGAATEVGQPSNKRRILGASSAGVATAASQPARRRPLTGTSPGVTTVSAQIQRKKSVTGTSVGVSTVGTTISRKLSLTGVSAGTATGAGQPNRVKPLVATSVGIASATGVPSKTNNTKNVSGSSAGTGVSTATATRRRPVTGASIGGSTTVATAARQRPLTGSAVATGVTTAIINDKRALTVASSGTVSAAGTVRRRAALVATSPGVATVSVTIGNRKTYNGLAVGVASASAQVRAKRFLFVASLGVTSVTVNLQKRGTLFAASIGTSATTATVTRRRSLTVTNAGVGSSSGVPTAKRRVATATSAGTVATIGSLSKVGAPTFRDLLANSAGRATTTVTINARRRLTAISSGVTTVAVIFRHERNMTVATGGTSTTTTTATRRRSLVVVSNGGSVCPTSFPGRKRPLTVSSAGQSSASAQIAVLHRLTGTSTGISTTAGQILRSRAAIIPAPSIGVAVTTVAILNARRALKSSNVVGNTVISGAPTTASSFIRGTVYSYAVVIGIMGRKGSMAASSAGGSSASASIRRKRYLLAICAGVAVSTATIRVRRLVTAPNPSVGVASTTASPSGRRNIMGVPSGPLLVNGVATTTALRPTRRKSLIGASVGTATAGTQVRRYRPLVAVTHGISTTHAAIANAGIVVWNGSTFAVGGTDPVVLWDDTDFSITGGGEITGWKDAEDQFIPVT